MSKDKKKKVTAEAETEVTNEQNVAEAEEPAVENAQPASETVSPDDRFAKELEAERNKFYHLYADFENFKKRTKTEKEGLYSKAVGDAAAEFLPAIDNLERAVAFSEDSSLKKGVEMVLSQMIKALENLGITAYGEKGDKFDPNIHEAVIHSDEEGVDPDTITEVLQRGYKTESRVIRHALVKVAN